MKSKEKVTELIKVIDIKMSRPRARSGDEFLLYRSKILKLLNYGGKEAEVGYYI